jgi:glycosyltransferase involved in cell wall biosynthesis
MKLYVDCRCLQDPRYSHRGIGFHTATLLAHARRWAEEPVAVIGLVAPSLPDLPDEYRALADAVRRAVMPRPDGLPAIHLQPSPMTHPPVDLAPLVGHPRIFACGLIYDFIPLEEPGYLPTAADHRAYVTNLVWLKGYPLLCPISACSGRRLRELVGVDEARTEVTGVGLRTAFERFDPTAHRPPALLSRIPFRDYFVLVGGQDPRKNAETVLQAHAAYVRRTGHRHGLVIVGKYQDDFRERLAQVYAGHGGRPDLLWFASDLPDGELAAVYHQALATVCPSRNEGFSIPVIEGIACGSPVLASDIAAHRELVDQTDALFAATDAARLAQLLGRVVGEPGWRRSLRRRQRPVAARFAQEAVAGRFWRRLYREYRLWRSCGPARLRPRKPKLAILSPYPPDRSGVADYTARSLEYLSRYADLDVFTEAAAPTPSPAVRRFHPLSDLPYLTGEYDRVVAVIGNSHFHVRMLEYHRRFGGACLAHDNRLAELYHWLYGPEGFARLASRSLGRPVSVAEAQGWMADPGALPTIFFDELVPTADPLIVHSRGIQAQVQKQYGCRAEYLPFCSYRQFDREELTAAHRREVRARLGVPPDRILILTLGFVCPRTKAPAETVWALELLRDWGLPIEFYFVGSSEHAGPDLGRQIEELKLSDRVHFTENWVSDARYRDFLIAADFGIQLRTHGFGGLSGGVLDCISAGLPTVVNDDLARATDAPDFVLRTSDALSPVLIAEQIATAYQAGRHTDRLSPQREAYLREHSFERYAELMMEVLGLGAAARAAA